MLEELVGADGFPDHYRVLDSIYGRVLFQG